MNEQKSVGLALHVFNLGASPRGCLGTVTRSHHDLSSVPKCTGPCKDISSSDLESEPRETMIQGLGGGGPACLSGPGTPQLLLHQTHRSKAAGGPRSRCRGPVCGSMAGFPVGPGPLAGVDSGHSKGHGEKREGHPHKE